MSPAAQTHEVTRQQRVEHRAGHARPDLAGPVLWTLAASVAEVSMAGGLPRRIQTELSKMLDGWYGESAAKVTQATATAVTALSQLVGQASLRLSGTATHLLIELDGRAEPLPHLRWATLELPHLVVRVSVR